MEPLLMVTIGFGFSVAVESMSTTCHALSFRENECFMRSNIHRINGPWTGQLAILARPRGNDWLMDEIQCWRNAGIDVVVSLLTTPENIEFGLTDEGRIVLSQGLKFVSFPIADYGVPKSEESVLRLTNELYRLLSSGKCVGIHCRQGIGRSGLIAASLLVAGGQQPAEAFEHVELGRGAPVPDTADQRTWVFGLAMNLKSAIQIPFAVANGQHSTSRVRVAICYRERY
jgi:protein-tyrosine phosphatase